MDRLLGIMTIFVAYPLLAAGVGVVLLGLGRLMRRRLAMAVGLAWLVYAVYELGMKLRWLCSGECNIRVDLLVICPVLLVGLGAAGVSLFRVPSGKRRPA